MFLVGYELTIQSKGSKQPEKIEQPLNLGSLLLQRFCRVSTTFQVKQLIEVKCFNNGGGLSLTNLKILFWC
jgi:hypothetical protein